LRPVGHGAHQLQSSNDKEQTSTSFAHGHDLQEMPLLAKRVPVTATAAVWTTRRSVRRAPGSVLHSTRATITGRPKRCSGERWQYMLQPRPPLRRPVLASAATALTTALASVSVATLGLPWRWHGTALPRQWNSKGTTRGRLSCRREALGAAVATLGPHHLHVAEIHTICTLWRSTPK
jgi:hypothetical protein